MSTASQQTSQQSAIHRLHGAETSAGERLEALARQAAAQAHDDTLSVAARLQFLRESDRLFDVAALADADAILAAHAGELA